MGDSDSARYRRPSFCDWLSRRGLAARGFTLMELLITLTVAGILIAIAMPAFSSFVQDTRLSNEANTLVYDLNLARSDAVKFDTAVQVCASTDQTTCAGAGTWAPGWVVLCPAACPPDLGGSPALLRVAPPLNTGNTADEASGAVSVSFAATGQTGGGNLQFVFCDRRGAAYARDVEINAIGEITSSTTPGQSVAGVALGC